MNNFAIKKNFLKGSNKSFMCAVRLKANEFQKGLQMHEKIRYIGRIKAKRPHCIGENVISH